jgi:hypothetical protein
MQIEHEKALKIDQITSLLITSTVAFLSNGVGINIINLAKFLQGAGYRTPVLASKAKKTVSFPLTINMYSPTVF